MNYRHIITPMLVDFRRAISLYAGQGHLLQGAGYGRAVKRSADCGVSKSLKWRQKAGQQVKRVRGDSSGGESKVQATGTWTGVHGDADVIADAGDDIEGVRDLIEIAELARPDIATELPVSIPVDPDGPSCCHCFCSLI